jgi:hypothetical protein
MAKEVGRKEGVCGGSPILIGTRLTCADIVRDVWFRGKEAFLETHQSLSADDIMGTFNYCSTQQCIAGESAAYCSGCTLDKTEVDLPEVHVENLEALRRMISEGQQGPFFLGSKHDFIEGPARHDLWKYAAILMERHNE